MFIWKVRVPKGQVLKGQVLKMRFAVFAVGGVAAILAFHFGTLRANANDRVAIVYRAGYASICDVRLRNKKGDAELLAAMKNAPVDAAGHVAIFFPKGDTMAQLVGWMPKVDRSVSPDERLKKLRRGEAVAGAWHRGKAWVERSFKQSFSPAMLFWINLAPGDREKMLASLDRLEQAQSTYQFGIQFGKPFAEGAYNCITVLPQVFAGTSIDMSFVPESGAVADFFVRVRDRSVPLTQNELQQWFFGAL